MKTNNLKVLRNYCLAEGKTKNNTIIQWGFLSLLYFTLLYWDNDTNERKTENYTEILTYLAQKFICKLKLNKHYLNI